jgi:cell division protein FtsI/penicillin-binding protein 2
MLRRANLKKNSTTGDNRLNLVLTIIFLLGVAIVFRLYRLQVLENDLYKGKAESQQGVDRQLQPQRGQIFINNYSESLNKNTLSVFATNKNFAVLYAVPKDFPKEMASSTANSFYNIFDAAQTEKNVNERLAQEDRDELKKELDFIESLPLEAAEKNLKINEVLAKKDSLKLDPSWLEFRKIKKELILNEAKNTILSDYQNKLIKDGDPYEELKKKVAVEDLLKIYAALLNLTADDLELKNNVIYKKNEPEGMPVEAKGLGYQILPYRYYPENSMGAQILGYVDYENKGKYGLEEYFESDLKGQEGSLKGERSGGANKNVIIVNNREYVKPENGTDLVLTIDRTVEFYICKKLEEVEPRYKFDSASIVIINPGSGEIIAMCSWPAFDPNNYADVKSIRVFNNPVVAQQYEPGSVFKTITAAAALDQGKITPETTYNDAGQKMISGWDKPIKNSDYATAGAHGPTNMVTVLEKSLNLGAIFMMEKIGAKTLVDYIRAFGFGEKFGIELGAEASGNIKNLVKDNIRPVDAATASFGQGLSVTPLQMVMSYAALANKGILMKPFIIKEMIKNDGSKIETKPHEIKRVVSEQAANTVNAMMVKVVETGTAKKAGVPGYYVAGKTGTAQVAGKGGVYLQGNYIHSFVGFAPVDKPKFVMLVKLDHPKGFNYAESTAVPIFGEIADFLLKYYQVPKER